MNGGRKADTWSARASRNPRARRGFEREGQRAKQRNLWNGATMGVSGGVCLCIPLSTTRHLVFLHSPLVNPHPLPTCNPGFNTQTAPLVQQVKQTNKQANLGTVQQLLVTDVWPPPPHIHTHTPPPPAPKIVSRVVNTIVSKCSKQPGSHCTTVHLVVVGSMWGGAKQSLVGFFYLEKILLDIFTTTHVRKQNI